MAVNFKVTDRRVPGANIAEIDQDEVDIMSNLQASLTTIGDLDKPLFSRRCDYTGLPLSWTTGPMSPSMEAVYPVFLSGTSVQYHAPTNIAFVMSFLNLVKRQLPPLCLPLAAQWIRILESQVGWHVKYRQLAWVYTAMINVGILAKVYASRTHEDRVKMWGSWSPEKQRAVLESLRTGILSPITKTEVDEFGIMAMPRRSHSDIPEYATLLRIAQKYDLSKDDFEFFLTIETPECGHPVFYPFHVLSRAEAAARGWDWKHTLSFARERLGRMRGACNIHAERAGLGDPMDATKFVYWMAHYWCDEVRKVRANFPNEPQEEVRFRVLDRWGFPVVPWDYNLFCASFCKKQDHGIAMKFGLTFDTAHHQAFDPVEHFDLSECTIAIDAMATNMAMWNHPKES